MSLFLSLSALSPVFMAVLKEGCGNPRPVPLSTRHFQAANAINAFRIRLISSLELSMAVANNDIVFVVPAIGPESPYNLFECCLSTSV